MIPHVGVHQTASVMMGDRIIDTTCQVHNTASVMMGDRIVKCVGTLPNDNKGGIH